MYSDGNPPEKCGQIADAAAFLGWLVYASNFVPREADPMLIAVDPPSATLFQHQTISIQSTSPVYFLGALKKIKAL